MRNVYLPLLGAALLLGGCASEKARRSHVLAPPHQEELLQMERIDRRPTQVIAVVEGDNEAPRLTLVPDFAEPELTPEERAALDQREIYYEPLTYPDAARDPARGVLPRYAGPQVGTAGRGGVVAAVDNNLSRRFGTFSAQGGVRVGTYAYITRSGFAYTYAGGVPVVGVSGQSGVTTGVDTASRSGYRAAPQYK
jgi:hypothetical protein